MYSRSDKAPQKAGFPLHITGFTLSVTAKLPRRYAGLLCYRRYTEEMTLYTAFSF